MTSRKTLHPANRAPAVSNFVSMLLLIAAGVFLGGCASMTDEGSNQMILVRSTPPGASIFVDGERVGQTPEFVEIRRSKRPQVEVLTATGRESVPIQTRYRWGESFRRNFVFYIFAPIGWGIDFLTGAAWDVRDVNPVFVQLAPEDRKNPKPARRPEAVIAPPRSPSVSMSDEGGRALEKVLREKFNDDRSGFIVRPYDETVSYFGEYEHGSKNRSRHQRLLASLRADLLYESFIETDDAGWVLKSESRDVFGSNVKPGPTIRLGRDGEGPRLFGVGFGLRPWWSRILPDTVGLDFVENKINVELGGKEYGLQSVYGDEWWATGLRYLSAINISSTPDRRREYGSRWEFSAVPSLRFSRRQVRVTDLPPPTNGTFIEKDPEFIRWSAAGGYGLEIGYLFSRHYFYFDVIPMLTWSQISWRQNATDQSATRVNVTAQVELGYTYVFDSNWLIRIFTRSQSENVELWQDAFGARLGNEYRPTAATGIVSGLTLGYRFESDRYQMVSAGK